ncbi:MAG TPA: hypothetical protein PK490_19815 [Prosthecobacter sp.]|nr:hypothetical protein [Prosthecobacter sp.]HRK16537.1 hypothetical protein [Prosthecobacter sp.]
MSNNQIEIHIAAAENKVTKVINSYGKKKTYHNGGFRVGVSIEGEGDFICITKSATYSGLAESWGVLRAVEWAIAQGIKDLKVCTVDHCTSSRRKSGFFLKLAHAKAEVAGMTLDVERIGKEDNDAVDLARDQDAKFLPRVADDTEEVKAAIAIVLKSYETRDGEINPAAEEGMPELPVPESVEINPELVEG